MPTPTVPELLDFEAAHATTRRGVKEEAIRARFGIPPIRYYQLLGRAITTEQAVQHDPITTRRVTEKAARYLQSRQENTRS